jgi:hypothetical protein
LLAALVGLPATAQPLPIDPHKLFEEKCGRCHEHAGTFAREKLTLENGEVLGLRSGKSVRKMLAGHYGELSNLEVDLILDMFRRQIESGGLFERKCRFCHNPASDFARRTLILRNGQLFGRYSGQSVEDLLTYHGRLEVDEGLLILDMLTWQLTATASKTSSE